jgi:Major Facilitator Superfamily
MANIRAYTSKRQDPGLVSCQTIICAGYVISLSITGKKLQACCPSVESSGMRADHLIPALCRICEPIAFMSIFPYAYRMIETFNIAKDPDQISIYAGMLITSFAFAEFSTGMIWGRISDKVGRKPVLIFGLLGTALSMIMFGFATNLQTAIIARALGGLLNGNVGVLQTTVAELVTVKEHQPRAYSIMPFVWCLGSIIGPVMGGALAQPCIAYPWLFDRDSIFGAYPFLLPNLVCVVILLFGIATGILFLEETHADKKYRSDWGRRLGNILLQKALGSTFGFSEDFKSHNSADSQPSLIDDELPPGYQSTEGSPRIPSVTRLGVSSEPDIESRQSSEESLGLVKTFNKQVVLVILGYGILA